MATRTAEAIWEGNLKDGRGVMKFGSGAFEGAYTFASRFESGKGTNPEELIGAAHAGCFSMALSASLAKDGHTPDRIHTTASVQFENSGDGPRITHILLETEGTVSGIDEATFVKYAQEAKANCPVSRALTGVEIEVHAKLK